MIARPERPALRTLLVEDERDIAEVVEIALPQCQCLHCEDGVKALELLRRGQQFDLLILDMLLPGCPGIDVFVEARRRMPQLPVLIISGHASNLDIRRILQYPRTKLLPKPFSLNDLRRDVQKLSRLIPAAAQASPGGF